MKQLNVDLKILKCRTCASVVIWVWEAYSTFYEVLLSKVGYYALGENIVLFIKKEGLLCTVLETWSRMVTTKR